MNRLKLKMNYNEGQRDQRGIMAFTLVEMLTVIAIIGILAALIVGGSALASSKMRRARVEAERDALVTAIENYKRVKGFYPPDNVITNATHTYMVSLFYELTGVSNINNGTQIEATSREILGDSNPGGSSKLSSLFGVGGILNNSSTTESGQPSQNFFGSVSKSVRTAQFLTSPGNSVGPADSTFTLFGIAIGHPVYAPPVNQYPQASGPAITPWNYVVTNPTNNPAEFDLWIDVVLSGHTNRISNWSHDPQVLP